ncbi:Hpt domain-containing protein [Sphingobacterium griseoflavum]|uniref:HPt domain-containing protein n=1 Tax=Sphingobacterium griseoflavum TaxID=1474952 RepID=A0ABQ3HYJ2_9SPHI|nr:Hpt domain-containing protein [Sphingobacterium griseoflavum]GHE47641.1 hypothetical protein GCM10017764_33480 [Sphingobacterium griseoflavum]
MTNKYTLIDPVAIQTNLMQNAALINQFLALYLVQIPVDRDALEEAMRSAHNPEIASKAHHIKPTMEYIGATKLQSALQELETAAKQGDNIEALERLFAELSPQFDTLLTEIQTYMNELALSP